MPRNGDPLKVQAIVSFDQKTIADTAAQNKESNATQKSIKKATWAAFGAVTIYAVVTTFTWNAMLEQNKIAARALEQSKMDERAWVEIEPVKPELLSPPTDKVSATFTCNVYPKNVGKTVAADVNARATDVMSVDGWDEHAEVVRNAQDMLFSEKDLPHIHVPRVLAPSSVSPVPFRLTCQAPQVFPSGHQGMYYLIGRIDYCDQFNVKHSMRFCFYVINPRGEIWACENGNDEDRNSETPTPETSCGKPN